MNPGHDAEHEERLERLLVENGADGELARLLESCADCRRAHQRLLELQKSLDDAGAEMRADLADKASSPAPGEDQVQEKVRALAASRRVQRSALRPTPWKKVAIAVAAALVLTTVGYLLMDKNGGGRNANDIPLGTQLRALDPQGEVEAYLRFTWEGGPTMKSGGWYEVEVFDAAHVSVVKSDRLEARRFIPSQDMRKQMPDAIVWVVRLYDPGPKLVQASPEQEARRKR